MAQEQRDFVGYGRNIPKVEWPQGARIRREHGPELRGGGRIQRPRTETHIGRRQGTFIPILLTSGTRVWSPTTSMAVVPGVWRILRLLEQYEVNGTIFACGRAIERNPEAARGVYRSGSRHCGTWLPVGAALGYGTPSSSVTRYSVPCKLPKRLAAIQ